MSNKNRLTVDELLEQQQEIKDANPTPNKGVYTGPAVIKVLAINPSKEQLAEIIGPGAEKFDVSYPKKKDFNDVMYRPITLWLQDIEGLTRPIPCTFKIYKEEQAQSKGNNYCFINEHGRTYYAADKKKAAELLKSDTVRRAFIDESLFVKFLKCIFRFRDNDKMPFMTSLKALGLDNLSLFGGDNYGIDQIKEKINNSLVCFGGVLSARRRNEYYVQDLIKKEELFYFLSPDKDGNIQGFDEFLLELVQKSFDKADAASFSYSYGKTITTSTFQRFTPPANVAPPSANPLDVDDDEDEPAPPAAEEEVAEDDLPF